MEQHDAAFLLSRLPRIARDSRSPSVVGRGSQKACWLHQNTNAAGKLENKQFVLDELVESDSIEEVIRALVYVLRFPSICFSSIDGWVSLCQFGFLAFS